MHWTHDPDVDAVDIDIAGTDIAYPIKCVDLWGAHVILDIDTHGRVVSIEIIGPVKSDRDDDTFGNFIPLSELHLENYLLRKAND